MSIFGAYADHTYTSLPDGNIGLTLVSQGLDLVLCCREHSQLSTHQGNNQHGNRMKDLRPALAECQNWINHPQKWCFIISRSCLQEKNSIRFLPVSI